MHHLLLAQKTFHQKICCRSRQRLSLPEKMSYKKSMMVALSSFDSFEACWTYGISGWTFQLFFFFPSTKPPCRRLCINNLLFITIWRYMVNDDDVILNSGTELRVRFGSVPPPECWQPGLNRKEAISLHHFATPTLELGPWGSCESSVLTAIIINFTWAAIQKEEDHSILFYISWRTMLFRENSLLKGREGGAVHILFFSMMGVSEG